jgi:hypothetical protein
MEKDARKLAPLMPPSTIIILCCKCIYLTKIIRYLGFCSGHIGFTAKPTCYPSCECVLVLHWQHNNYRLYGPLLDWLKDV